MSIKEMKKEDLELLSYKDITNLLLEENKKPMNTADLFKTIIHLLELPNKEFETKIGDYYTSLTTDKRFILLSDGTWDIKSRHTSDKVVKITEEDDDELEEEFVKEDESEDEIDEDNYDDTDEDYDDDTEEDLKDLVVLDEDELELDK